MMKEGNVMNLERALGNGYIVASDSWLNVIVVWDGTGWFKMYRQVDTDAWVQVDSVWSSVFNTYGAKTHAKKLISIKYNELEEAR